MRELMQLESSLAIKQTKNEDAFSDSSYAIVTDKVRMGVLQVDVEGLIIGAYWLSQKVTTNSYTEKTVSGRVHLGYNF